MQQKTIEPFIKSFIARGSRIYTDEFRVAPQRDGIYDRLKAWGYEHQAVNHSTSEYARDEDDDGFHEVHVNSLEGFWSLLRSWLRPHRGVSQEKLPLYLAFFEFVHNVRRRGRALLPSLIEVLVTPLNAGRAMEVIPAFQTRPRR